jgi:ribosome-associated heat shock protein Hsp15
VDTARVDQWLWAIRVCKTRSAATEACRAGHVRVNGVRAKAATPVRPGDRVEARLGGRDRVLEVVDPITKRVGAPVAAACLVDHSPAPAPVEHVRRLFPRPAGSGRPTKRERRQTDRFRAR